MLDLLEPGQPASIERDVFPRLVGDGLYGYVGEGYWLDIGTPDRYLQGTFDILEGTVDTAVAARMGDVVRGGRRRRRRPTGRIIPSALVEERLPDRRGARRSAARVVLGGGVTIGEDTTVEHAVVLRGRRDRRNCTLRGCIIGAGARIGDGCHVDGLSVLGEGVTLGAGNIVSNGARLFPGVTLPDRAIRF